MLNIWIRTFGIRISDSLRPKDSNRPIWIETFGRFSEGNELHWMTTLNYVSTPLDSNDWPRSVLIYSSIFGKLFPKLLPKSVAISKLFGMLSVPLWPTWYRGLSILSVLSPKRDDLSSFETLKLRGHLWPKIPGSLIASSCFPKEFAFCMAGWSTLYSQVSRVGWK